MSEPDEQMNEPDEQMNEPDEHEPEPLTHTKQVMVRPAAAAAEEGEEEGEGSDPDEDSKGSDPDEHSDEHSRRVYAMYKEADKLPETNGHLSLNLRPGAGRAIDALLGVMPGDCVFWVGCGNAPEVISAALRFPETSFVAVDPNSDAIDVAKRKVAELRASDSPLLNLDVRVGDVMNGDVMNEPHSQYTHIYSTAVADSELYRKLRSLAAGCILCMLKSMWEGEVGEGFVERRVWLSGSGEQKWLMARRMPSEAARLEAHACRLEEKDLPAAAVAKRLSKGLSRRIQVLVTKGQAALDPPGNELHFGVVQTMGLQHGDRLWGEFRGDGVWYLGTLRCKGDEYDVLFDDGDVDDELKGRRWRRICATALVPATSTTALEEDDVEDDVEDDEDDVEDDEDDVDEDDVEDDEEDVCDHPSPSVASAHVRT